MYLEFKPRNFENFKTCEKFQKIPNAGRRVGVPIEANMSQLLDVPNSLGTLGLYPKVYFVFIFFKASFRIFRGNKKHETCYTARENV